jgi:hypothetical protein
MRKSSNALNVGQIDAPVAQLSHTTVLMHLFKQSAESVAGAIVFR